jgi:hypothetical protein
MRRGTIFTLLFVLIAAGLVGISQFLGNQPPVEYTLAVDPLIEPWAREAITAFNATQPVINTRRIQFRISAAIDDIEVWTGTREWVPNNHPDAWLAASSLSLQYTQEGGLVMVPVTASIARTPLVWGGYLSRVDALTENGVSALDWAAVQQGAVEANWGDIGGESNWQFIKLTFQQPIRKIGGLGALLTGAAAHYGTESLPAGGLNSQELRTWLLPVLESISNPSRLPADPAAAMASQGYAVGEIGLLPEVLWLNNLGGLQNRESFRVAYPTMGFVLDFPLSSWPNDTLNTEREAAVSALGAYLMSDAEQARLLRFGLRPAGSEPDATAPRFADAQDAGVLFAPAYGTVLTAPPLRDVQGFIQWLESNQ